MLLWPLLLMWSTVVRPSRSFFRGRLKSRSTRCDLGPPALHSQISRALTGSPYGQKTQPNSGSNVFGAFLRLRAGNLDRLNSCELKRMILYFDYWSIRRTEVDPGSSVTLDWAMTLSIALVNPKNLGMSIRHEDTSYGLRVRQYGHQKEDQ